nr:hypothetical protein [Tanacetum cinerariifolium]
MDLQKMQKNQIFRISVDLLQNTNFFSAFTASADVPSIYINALGITPKDSAHPFTALPAGDLPWRTILSMINQCLTGKNSGSDRPRHPVLQILWGVVTETNIDYAELIWEEFVQEIKTTFSDASNLKEVDTTSTKGHILLFTLRQMIIHSAISNSSPKENWMRYGCRKPCQTTTVTYEEGGKKKKAPLTGKSKRPAPAKQHVLAKQTKPAKEETSKLSPLKKICKGKVMKVRKGKRGIQMSLESFQAPFRGVAIRETDPGLIQKLPKVKGNGKGIAIDEQAIQSLLDLQQPKKKSTTDQYIFQRQTPVTHDASIGPSAQPQDDTYANVVHDTPSPADAKTGADTKKSNSEGDTKILNVGEEHGEDVSNTVDLEERTIKLDEGQAGSDPDFIATIHPQVHKSLKLTTEEHVHIENPPSSSGTLSSMKNLDDAFTFSDKFLNDKPTEEEPEVVHNALQAPIRKRFRDLSEFEMKEILRDWMFESGSYRLHPEHTTLYEALEASMDRENKEEFNEEMAKSCKRRRDDQDPPQPPPKDSNQSKKKKHDYDASASKQPPIQNSAYGISYWWFKRKEFYIIRHSAPSDRNAVISHMRILSVVSFKTFSRYGYTYLKEIVLHRANNKEYKISEADFKNLHPNDFEDMYLLHLQGKLNHLSGADKVYLFNAINLWIRNIVIRQSMEDLQLDSFEVENRLVDDVVKERSSTRLLTKGDLFVVSCKVRLADNSFEIGILTKEYEFEVISSLANNVANICVIGDIDFRGDQIDVVAIMVVETNQKVMRSHTIVLEVTKFAMPENFAREEIKKLLGLKLVLNTLMKSIVEPMSIECGKRRILESFNYGYLALDKFNQLRKQGLGLGDNTIAIAKESTKMKEREKSVLQGVSSTSDSDIFGFNVLMDICSHRRYVEGWKYAIRYEVREGIKENELVSAKVPDQCTPTQNMWLMFWGYRLRNRPAEVTDDSKWDRMDGMVVANLHLALADGVLSSIEEKRSAKEIWDHLARLYEARSLHNKTFLKRKLYALCMTESTLVTEHVEALVVTRGRSMKPGSNHNHGKSKTGKKKNFKCFKCGKPSHFRKDCRGLNTSYPQGNFASTSEDGNALCCEAAGANESRNRFVDIWLFDTRAIFHMTVRREWFHQYKPIFGGASVYSCNDHELKIIKNGSIMVKMHDGTIRTIRDVRHVEGLKKNLLSLGQLDDLGCKVEIQNKIMKIIKGALVLMKGEKVATNLYQLKGEIMEEAEASVASHSLSHIVVVSWHQKLGHMSKQGMKILVERKLIPGLTKVFFTFLICWVYPIKKKSDVFEVFKVYKAWVELDFGKTIKCLRTDNREWSDRADEQNLVRKSKSNVGNCKLGKIILAEAVNTACYVINRSPSTAVELKTPMEMWTGKPVNYSDLHIFGSPVYVMYNTQETTKLDPKSKRCLFLGYADGIKGYRLWDATAHKVVVSRDVVFMEDKIQENEEGDNTTRETTSIQIEKEFQSNDSSEAIPQHEKEGIDFNEIFSLVVRMTTIRVVLAMCATYDLHLEQLDVKTSFLYGMKKKFTCSNQKVLNKKEKRTWFAGPNKDHINKLKAQLARKFEMKGLGPANKILGMQIHRDIVSRKIWLSKKSYVKKILQRFNMQDCKPISTPFPIDVKLSSKMSPSCEKKGSRLGVMSRYMAEPGREHWEAVKRILIYVKGTLYVALCFGDSDLTVTGYVDSDYAGDLDGSKSTTGNVFTLSGGTQRRSMVEDVVGRARYHFVREKVEEGTVDMQKIHIDDNVADYLTKAINRDKFICCRSSCGLAET